MSVAFLTPEVTSSREVHARSPMERLAVAAGARLSQIEGWSVANAFSEPSVEWDRLTRTVGFVDRSSLGKLEIQGEPEALARIAAQLGVPLEPGLASGAPGAWWCPVTPGRVLVLCEPTDASATRAAVARAAEDSGGSTSVIDVTCGQAALALVGPQARELLARFCAIDVRPALAPARAFRPGSIARTPGYLLVERPDSLLVLVGWALGAYLWEVVADAAASLGGGPVGAEALRHHLDSGDA
jgi:sarcosine oxidase subunit gamma